MVAFRFYHAEKGPIEEWERRLIEPAIVVALQVPFVGRLGATCPAKVASEAADRPQGFSSK